MAKIEIKKINKNNLVEVYCLNKSFFREEVGVRLDIVEYTNSTEGQKKEKVREVNRKIKRYWKAFKKSEEALVEHFSHIQREEETRSYEGITNPSMENRGEEDFCKVEGLFNTLPPNPQRNLWVLRKYFDTQKDFFGRNIKKGEDYRICVKIDKSYDEDDGYGYTNIVYRRYIVCGKCGRVFRRTAHSAWEEVQCSCGRSLYYVRKEKNSCIEAGDNFILEGTEPVDGLVTVNSGNWTFTPEGFVIARKAKVASVDATKLTKALKKLVVGDGHLLSALEKLLAVGFTNINYLRTLLEKIIAERGDEEEEISSTLITFIGYVLAIKGEKYATDLLVNVLENYRMSMKVEYDVLCGMRLLVEENARAKKTLKKIVNRVDFALVLDCCSYAARQYLANRGRDNKAFEYAEGEVERFSMASYDCYFELAQEDADLIKCGNALGICVGQGQYAYYTRKNTSRVVVVYDKDNMKEVACIEFSKREGETDYTIAQVKGKGNQLPPKFILSDIASYLDAVCGVNNWKGVCTDTQNEIWEEVSGLGSVSEHTPIRKVKAEEVDMKKLTCEQAVMIACSQVHMN